MDHKKYTETNRTAWNKALPYHRPAKEKTYRLLISQPGYSCLDNIVTGQLEKIGVRDKNVAQLGCNDGRELLSLKNMGAARCVGFDICDPAIDEARWLSRESGIPAEFVRTDLYDIDSAFHNTFDLIYLSIGVLTWLPDLPRFFEIAAALLKKNGTILIYDSHPFLMMLGDIKKDEPLLLKDSYFSDTPQLHYESLDYYFGTPYDAGPKYEFYHTLSGIINGFLKNHMEITVFEEYPNDISVCYEFLENSGLKLPLSFLIAARKP